MINIANEKECATKLMQAFKSGKEDEIKQAWENFHTSVVEACKKEVEDMVNVADVQVLSQRGVRQLTSQEKKFYEKWIEGAKSSNPKQAFTDLLTADGGMPETIIEDVFRDLEQNHPLLAKVNFQNVKYLTKWLLNDNPEDMAIWGEINAEITKQIEGGFKVFNITQGKLSAFLVLPLDMLALGPVFLDAYVRRVLKEVMACGLEYGIIKGIGVKGEPIGLIRDIHKGVSFSEETGYPAKEKVAVKGFTTVEYGALIADNMVRKENGKLRTITGVQLIVNPIDYLKKVMPATTVQNVNGQYIRDLFPIPTEVIQSTALEEGEAVLVLLEEYFLGAGGDKQGVIEYSDEFKFLEDKRTYKSKMYAFGRCEDNTSAVYLNITDLEPAYVIVKNLETVVSA